MNRSSTNPRQDVDFPQQQGNHCCPLCPKSYKSATWLDHHIKTKHSTRLTQEHKLLAHTSNNQRTSASNNMLISQSFQQTDRPALNVELNTVFFLLKQLFPLMENLLPILEQLSDASSDAHALRRNDLRNPKRRASSPDLRVESKTKRRELSTSISEACVFGGQNESEDYIDGTVHHLRSSTHSDDSNGAKPSASRVTLSEGNHFKLGSPNFYPKHPHASPEPLLHSSAPNRTPNSALPQQRRRLRLSPTPRLPRQSENSIQVPNEFLEWYQLPPVSRERIPGQCERSSMWSNSAQLLLGTTYPKSDARLEETPYQELDQHHSVTQGSQQQASQHNLGDHVGNIFQDWDLPTTPDLGSFDSMISAAQLMRNFDERD